MFVKPQFTVVQKGMVCVQQPDEAARAQEMQVGNTENAPKISSRTVESPACGACGA